MVRLKVQPRSSRNQVAGVEAGELKVKLTAPPVEGEANRALVLYLAEKLGTGRGAIRLLSGETGRHKAVLVEGLEPHAVAARLLSGGER